MAAIFDVDPSSISRHIRNIFNDGELEEESNVQKVHIANSDKPIKTYGLDVVISVGYRVNSKVATKFRQWATQALKTYVEQGYVINEKALRESPEKLNKLAAEVRALRSSEKQVYAKVRECFKISSSDYDPTSRQVKSFYALLQDKFHHAVTGMTSSKLVMDRADHLNENMGLQTMKGEMPTMDEVQVGKNYLRQHELYRLHLLSEQFLLYAKSTALTERKMTMQSLHNQLDRLLTLNEYPVFDGYQDFIRDEAVNHAKRELVLYRKRKKIESLNIKYDEELLAAGEYDDLLLGELTSSSSSVSPPPSWQSLSRFAVMPFARASPPMRPSATAAAFLPSSVTLSSISPVAIRPIMTARWLASAGRFSPFGPFATNQPRPLRGPGHQPL